jgi:probable addiction module antidote protein
MSLCATLGLQIGPYATHTRPSLYKALLEGGRPEFSTVLKVINALGLKLKIAA